MSQIIYKLKEKQIILFSIIINSIAEKKIIWKNILGTKLTVTSNHPPTLPHDGVTAAASSAKLSYTSAVMLTQPT